MMRLDWLNRTLDNERDGMSTYGARPRSANWTTSVARSRIEPRVFLSLTVSVTVSEVFLGFLAMVCLGGRFLGIHNQYICPKILGGFFDFPAAVIQLSIGHSGFAFCDVNQSAVELLPGAIAVIFDRGDRSRHFAQVT